MSKALLELFIPARDIVWGRAVVVHGVLVEVGGVEVGLDGGDNGGTQATHPQSCNKISVKKQLNPVVAATAKTVGIELIHLAGFFQLGHKRKQGALTFPVEAVEPLVLLDVPNPSLLVAKSLRTVVSEMVEKLCLGARCNFWMYVILGRLKPAQLLDQLLSTSGDLSWEVYRVNSLENFSYQKMTENTSEVVQEISNSYIVSIHGFKEVSRYKTIN